VGLGSYGKQDIKVGVNNFFLKSSECSPVATTPLNYTIEQVWDCLNTDLTTLNNYNLKLTYQMSRNDQFSLLGNMAEKVRNARGADDLHPIDATNRQKGVADPALGSSLWKTGAPKTYKAMWRHIFSDKFAMELQYAHVGNNFVLDFHEDALKDVQPSFEITTSFWDRSFNASQFVRPTNLFDLTGTRSASGFLGGDHAIKFGVRYRQDRAVSTNHRGGNVEARFRNGVGGRGQHVPRLVHGLQPVRQLGLPAGHLHQAQGDRARGAALRPPVRSRECRHGAGASVLRGPDPDGRGVQPASDDHFNGADTDVKFTDVSPRLGINYDLKGDGKSVVKFNYARYASQFSDGDLASTLNPVVATFVRYPWTDTNGRPLRAAERDQHLGSAALADRPATDYLNPSRLTTSGTVDPNLSNEHTNEFILAFDKQIGNTFAFGWRASTASTTTSAGTTPPASPATCTRPSRSRRRPTPARPPRTRIARP
jgi:hypothetical protein